MTRRREDPEVRKEEILNAALRVAEYMGYRAITREDVAEAADTSCALVSRYFTTMELLKRAVIETALERKIVSIIIQGVSIGDPLTQTLPPELKQKILTFFD